MTCQTDMRQDKNKSILPESWIYHEQIDKQLSKHRWVSILQLHVRGAATDGHLAMCRLVGTRSTFSCAWTTIVGEMSTSVGLIPAVAVTV